MSRVRCVCRCVLRLQQVARSRPRCGLRVRNPPSENQHRKTTIRKPAPLRTRSSLPATTIVPARAGLQGVCCGRGARFSMRLLNSGLHREGEKTRLFGTIVCCIISPVGWRVACGAFSQSCSLLDNERRVSKRTVDERAHGTGDKIAILGPRGIDIESSLVESVNKGEVDSGHGLEVGCRRMYMGGDVQESVIIYKGRWTWVDMGVR